MSTLSVVTPLEYTECIVCKAPLGQDSKDQDYRVCLAHRQCENCGLELAASEVRLCHTISIEQSEPISILHARCNSRFSLSIATDPTLTVKQSYFDWLNTIRLMVEPNMELNKSTNESNALVYHSRFIAEMSHDQVFAHIGMLEACVMQSRLAISKDKELLKKRADAREEVKFAQAKKQAETSSRPTSTSANDNNEATLALFMANFGIISRKVALKLQRDRDKAAASLAKCGIPSNLAKEQADKILLDNIKQGKTKVTE